MFLWLKLNFNFSNQNHNGVYIGIQGTQTRCSPSFILQEWKVFQRNNDFN